jgi:dihydrofolate reductase
VRSNAADEVRKLKQQPGTAIVVWGSISIAQDLMKAGLIDEYRLVVCPVVLGAGRPLFGEGVASLGLTLEHATPQQRGAVTLQYVPTTHS